MIAFEISVNGEKLCTAGIGDKGVLSAIINGPKRPNLSVGGLANDEHLHWLEREAGFGLKVGDEVTVRIVEADCVDEPVGRSVSPTRAETEREVSDCLEEARSLLPDSLQESATASLKIFNERMAQTHLMGAMDVLEILGDLNAAPIEFWEMLRNAAFYQSAYDECGRYGEKGRASKAKTEQE